MGYNLRNRKSATSPATAPKAQPATKRVKKTDGMKTWADDMGPSLSATLGKHAIKKVSDFKKFDNIKALKDSLQMTESSPWLELFMYVAKTPAKEMEAAKTEIDYWRSSSKAKSPTTTHPVAANSKPTTTPFISIPKSPARSPVQKSPAQSPVRSPSRSTSLQAAAAASIPLPPSPSGRDKKTASTMLLPSPPSLSQKKTEAQQQPWDPRPKRTATSPSITPTATSPRLPSKSAMAAASVRRPSIDELKEGKSTLTHLPTGKALVDSGILKDRSVLTEQKQHLRRTPLTPTQPKSTLPSSPGKVLSPTKDWHVGSTTATMQGSLIKSPTKREGSDLEAEWSRQKKLKTDHGPTSSSMSSSNPSASANTMQGSMPSLSFSFGNASPKLRYY